jgi:hypothetical protein
MGMMGGTEFTKNSLVLWLTAWCFSASLSRLRHGSLVHGSVSGVRHGCIHSYSFPNDSNLLR